MSTAQSGNTVKIHYKGLLEDGSVFDTSVGREPFEFVLGSGMVIPGFDTGVSGMAIGEKKTISIPPEEAYGELREEMIIDVSRTQLPPDMEPEIGMMLMADTTEGSKAQLKIIEVSADSVKLDGNHPLAGKTLTFELELLEIA
ncbi:MAG: FKBP-type peptidyl-prolyl cis-trans isomerase [Calditrichia bacterium]